MECTTREKLQINQTYTEVQRQEREDWVAVYTDTHQESK